MNQQRIERLIASAIARQISGLVSPQEQDELMTAQQKAWDAQADLRQLVDSTIEQIFKRKRF